ncbi:hypothetical protein QQ008_07440 [Fulvivirgaceae bacterium BMA10]|uniref:DUF5050 domain-containing protein n=1 Tax=Splendidivirga corallicola TaxID=3051826 RepID=A0ABT8KLS6_9BACT|nr:hypothetical protein [Fulvivirgaceae bacterium BMA10]
MTVVKKLNFKRKKGMLYYIDKNGNLVEFNRKTKAKNVVVRSNITWDKGYLYFLDKNGDISRARMENN